jgi:hypothetical protein
MLTGIKVAVIYTGEYITEEPDAVIPQKLSKLSGSEQS